MKNKKPHSSVMWRGLFKACLLLCCVSQSACASYQSGEAYFRQENFAAAQKEWREAAEAGDVQAQYVLGLALLIGKYFPRDEEQGLRYLRAASEKGHSGATFALYSFESQMVALPDAVRLLEKAAAQGSAGAEYTLSRLRELIRRTKPEDMSWQLEAMLPVRVAPVAPSEMDAALQRGKAVIQKNCVLCHAGGIAGAPKIDDAARWRELKKTKGLDTLIKNAISGFNAHPPRGGDSSLSQEEVRDAVMSLVDRRK